MLPKLKRPWPVPDGTMWYAAPDYVRLTAKVRGNAQALYRTYEDCARQTADWLGENPYGAERWGFNGYSGSRIGPVAWGARDDSVCLQVSGPGAEKVRQINPPWDNVSRLDIQVTIWYEKDTPQIARDCARASAAAAAVCGHRPWAIRYIDGYGGGDTCYLGSRSSAWYIRIYDKWRERKQHPEWEHAWRFETEIKEGEGSPYWEGPKGSVPGPAYWAGACMSILGNRGVKLPGLVPNTVGTRPRVSERGEATARRLRWLAGQVAGSVKALRAVGVPLADIARALTGDPSPSTMAEDLEFLLYWRGLANSTGTAEYERKRAEMLDARLSRIGD